MARPMSLMMEGWMPSVGSSSTSSVRPRHQRAGDGELLLLAAGEVAAAPAQHGLEHREQLEQLVRDVALARAAGGAKPVSRFSCTVSSGKISRPCGT